MLSREEIGEIAERALRTCEADEVEVEVRAWRNYLTRYASNYIHQNLGEASLRITLRAVIGSRMGEASGEGADEGSLRRLARKASELARSSPEDPELLPRLGPQEYRKVDAFCEVAPPPRRGRGGYPRSWRTAGKGDSRQLASSPRRGGRWR